MGLLYILPCSENESDKIKSDGRSITLKSYGLPSIFWFYLLGVFFIIAMMFFAIYEPILKLANTSDALNVFLAYLVLGTLVLTPAALFLFFVYEKRVSKNGPNLKLGYCFLGFQILSKSFQLKDQDAFKVTHLLASPNLARIKKEPSMRAFENQGYWELYGELKDGILVLIDRNNRKADLVKISKILARY